MDDIIEIIIEIIGGIAEDTMLSRNVSRHVRMIAYIIVALLISAILCGMAYAIYEPLSVWRAIVALVCVAIAVAFDIYGFIKAWNGPKNKDDEEE